jgi:hypothetical protein
MALLRQCLQSVRAMRGDDLPPPLSQCTTERRMAVVRKAALTAAYVADGGRDERLEHAAADSLRRSLSAARTIASGTAIAPAPRNSRVPKEPI